jgi:hypothetical protein
VRYFEWRVSAKSSEHLRPPNAPTIYEPHAMPNPKSSCRAAWVVSRDNDDADWKAAEVALEAARRLPAGAERIEALRRAGRLRFDADRKRLAKEERQRGGSEKVRT